MILPLNKHRIYKVLKWVADGNSDGWTGEQEPDPHVNIREVKSLDEADIISSETQPVKVDEELTLYGKHMIMFDVDVPIQVIQSSTPGHYHVYFPNTYVPKEHLFELLDALANVGIVEKGYAAASKARGFAALRLPWVRKQPVF